MANHCARISALEDIATDVMMREAQALLFVVLPQIPKCNYVLKLTYCKPKHINNVQT